MMRITKYLLLATALTPLVITKEAIAPALFGKMVFFRALVELAVVAYAAEIFWKWARGEKTEEEGKKEFFFHPIVISAGIFFLTLAISAVFAVDTYRALWGNIERAEGLVGMLHYGALFALTALVFKKEDWITYLKIWIGGGLVLMLYGFLQFAGVERFPFALGPKQRIDSFIGNAAFFAAHLMFLMAFAGILLKEVKQKTFWWWASLAAFPLGAVGIFLSGTRGAILGMGAALAVFLIWNAVRGRGLSKKISLMLLGASVVFAAVFWNTKENEMWQKVPGLDRLAKTALQDRADSSTEMRLMTWKLSWKAFLERPVFGWGIENYMIAYLRHYDPDMALYGETWLDRAHNKIFDLLVQQGVAGLIAYVLLLGSALWCLRKRTYEKKVFSIFLAGYITQNLVLFDQFLSYLTLFALLGYLVFITRAEKGKEEKKISAAKGSGALLGAGVAAYLFVIYNAVPYVQARNFEGARNEGNLDEVMGRLEKAYQPYNFIQKSLRAHTIEIYQKAQPEIFEAPAYKPLANFLVQGLDEVIKREPGDVRNFIRFIEAAHIQAREHEEIYKITEALSRQALELAPRRQELLYQLAFALGGQGRVEESVRVAREAVALSPEVARAHYHLALMLSIGNEEQEKDAKKELARAEELDPEWKTFLGSDFHNIALLYAAWGMDDKVTDLVVRGINRRIAFTRIEYLERALRHALKTRDSKNAVLIANDLGARVEGLEEDMKVLADLAEKGEWEIIEKIRTAQKGAR